MSATKKILTPEQLAEAIPSVLRLGQAHFVSQCLYAAVQLGVPDAIGSEALSVREIAARLPGATNVEALQRSLRLLALEGVLAESAAASGDFVYCLTPTGALLQTGAPQPSMACGILHWMEKPAWGAWAEVPDYIAGKATTEPFRSHNGAPVFDFYREHPESAKPFNEFMTFFSTGELSGVLEQGGWDKLAGKTVVDVGGSYGTVMHAVAEKFPDVKCISFDLAEVIERVGAPPQGVTFAKGDMFDPATIPKGDIIFMKHILHDWGDEASTKILRSCHAALPDHGKVLVADAVLPDAGQLTATSGPPIYLDMMMMLFSGKERTHSQWEALAAASGFSLEEVRQTSSPTCKILVLAKK